MVHAGIADEHPNDKLGKAVDVCRRVRLLSGRDLRRDECIVFFGFRRRSQTCQINLRTDPRIEEHRGRSQFAVIEANLMRGDEARTELLRDLKCDLLRQSAGSPPRVERQVVCSVDRHKRRRVLTCVDNHPKTARVIQQVMQPQPRCDLLHAPCSRRAAASRRISTG